MSEIEKKVIIIDDIKNSNIQQAIFILKDKTKSMENYNIIDDAKQSAYNEFKSRNTGTHTYQLLFYKNAVQATTLF